METEKQKFSIMTQIKLLALTGRFTRSLHSIEVILMTDVILRIACTIISSQIFTNRGASGSSCNLGIVRLVISFFGVGESDIKEVCFVIGVILHHLWLSVFYFMSTATLCIVINLTKLRSNDTPWKQKNKYLL
jgi:hypothetical protein